MRFTEAVYKRKRNGKMTYDGMLRYYDEQGKRRTKHCERKTLSAAREALRIERAKLEKAGPKALEQAILTFAQLADYCEKEIYKHATYNDAGEKQDGVRDQSVYKGHLKHLRTFFKRTPLNQITVAHLKRYRSYRLGCKRTTLVHVPGQKEKKRTEVNISPSTVSRELNTLRAMLYEAVRNRWILENPFALARRNEVIRASDLKTRKLFLTFAQEAKLLKACETEDRRHLRALILTAVDTGARYGELIALTKTQLDFDGPGKIYGLRNYKGRGGDKSERNAEMTPRVREALLDIISNPPKHAFRRLRSGEKPSNQLVFGISNNVRTAWAGALRDAGLAHLGLHFHDLRHTPGTRVREILALPVIQKALGHKDPKLTAEIYINDSEGDISKFAQAVRRVVEEGHAQLLLEEDPETEIDQESNLVS